MDDEKVCPICGERFLSGACPHNAHDLIKLIHEARKWARKMYQLAINAENEAALNSYGWDCEIDANDELLRQLEEQKKQDSMPLYKLQIENEELRRRLDAAKDALIYYKHPEIWGTSCPDINVARDALESIQHGAIALPPEEAEKHYRKLAADALVKMDGER